MFSIQCAHSGVQRRVYILRHMETKLKSLVTSIGFDPLQYGPSLTWAAHAAER